MSDGLRDRARWTPADREIVRLAVPAFGALIAQPLYVLADTAVVGHLGTPELAGLAIAAGNTIAAELPDMIAAADKAGLFIQGLPA